MQFASFMKNSCSSTPFLSKPPQGKEATDHGSALPFLKHLCTRRWWDIPLTKVSVPQQCGKNSCNSCYIPHVVHEASRAWVEGHTVFITPVRCHHFIRSYTAASSHQSLLAPSSARTLQLPGRCRTWAVPTTLAVWLPTEALRPVFAESTVKWPSCWIKAVLHDTNHISAHLHFYIFLYMLLCVYF